MNQQNRFASFSRREFVQAGFSTALGLGLPAILARKATATVATSASNRRRAKSVIVVFLTGGCSHHDTFDMKPDAPAEIRGQFKPIATTVPGLQICEHLPGMAKRMHQCALVRSFAHREDNHLLATHQVLTGTKIAGGKFDQIASRNDWPCYASGLDHLRPSQDGIPTGVPLPTFLMEGPLIWPGQHAGFLGPKHDPWHIRQDPNKPDFRVGSLHLDDGADRLNDRRALLEQMNYQRQGSSLSEARTMTEQQEKAFTILTSGKVGQAFELEREPMAVRDRYGRHAFGQSLLLARRLVEAGVSVIQANMGHVQNWDHHGNIFPTLKDRMLSPLDRGMSALLDDLSGRGLLDDTMVALFGEFGRTPKVNTGAGRDHWGRAFFGVFAGGGVRGGQVIGKTDPIGSDPISHRFSPMDLGATIYEAMGVDHESDVRDQLQRPVRLNTGVPMDVLYS